MGCGDSKAARPSSSSSFSRINSTQNNNMSNNNNNNNNNNNKSGATQQQSSSSSPTNTTKPLSSSQSTNETPEGHPIILNIYNLQHNTNPNSKSFNECLGLGIYHTGIEIFGTEWSYAGDINSPPGVCGIFRCKPKLALPTQLFEESLILGNLPAQTPFIRIFDIIHKLTPAWDACTYHLLKHNCNHFTQSFRDAIAAEFTGIKIKQIPSYINRAARVANVIVPGSLYRSILGSDTTSSPVGPTSGNNNNNNNNKSKSNKNKKNTSDIPCSHGCTNGSGVNNNNNNTETDVVIYDTIPVTREEMENMTVRQIKTMMWLNGISWAGCIEKKDLIKAVETFREKLKE